jgi:DivIVA domain-containing protein
VTRSSIQRSDFPTRRRGYDPAAVDAHLRAVADEVEQLGQGSAGQPVAAVASEQVQRIVEAAERTAEQLRGEAGEEAHEHVTRVSAAAGELVDRIEALHDELGGVMERLRESASRLAVELHSLERDVAEVGGAAAAEVGGASAAEVGGASAAEVGSPAADLAAVAPEAVAVAPAPAAVAPEAVAVAPAPAAVARETGVEATAPAPPGRPEDEEAARLVALDMALGGSPREETERYLAEHYALPEADRLLDDVYARAGQ